MRQRRAIVENRRVEIEERGALRSQRNVVVAFRRVAHEQALLLFEIFERAHEVRIGKLSRAVEEFLRQNAGAAGALEETKHELLKLLESPSIHDFLRVVN